jgi:hypothetical protein
MHHVAEVDSPYEECGFLYVSSFCTVATLQNEEIDEKQNPAEPLATG